MTLEVLTISPTIGQAEERGRQPLRRGSIFTHLFGKKNAIALLTVIPAALKLLSRNGGLYLLFQKCDLPGTLFGVSSGL